MTWSFTFELDSVIAPGELNLSENQSLSKIGLKEKFKPEHFPRAGSVENEKLLFQTEIDITELNLPTVVLKL